MLGEELLFVLTFGEGSAILQGSRAATTICSAAAETEVSAMSRGLSNEARALDELGLTKNTAKVFSPKGASIPDALTPELSVERKDAARVSLTRQLQIQTQAARVSGRQSVLVVGPQTYVTPNALNSFD
jgi:hypothetical protein